MDRHYGIDETFLINFCEDNGIDIEGYEARSEEELALMARIHDAYLTGFISGLPIKVEEKKELATHIIRSLVMEACLVEKYLAKEKTE